MAGDDFITEREVDGAVLGRQREEHRFGDHTLHPADDPDSHDRKTAEKIRSLTSLKHFLG